MSSTTGLPLEFPKPKPNSSKAKDEFKLYYDRWHIPALEIKVGDRVRVNVSDIKTTCLSPKFSDKRLSPFKVVKVARKGAYNVR
jgi:hypothetical protein